MFISHGGQKAFCNYKARCGAESEFVSVWISHIYMPQLHIWYQEIH